MRLRVGAATDMGRVRSLNEDAFLSRPEQGLFVVCDGLGGAAAGEVASQTAVQSIRDQLNGAEAGLSAPAAPDEHGYLARTRSLADAIHYSNSVIYGLAQADARRAGMGTTVVCAWLAHDIASLAHVGDSRAYLWRGDRLDALTTDHSVVEAQVRAGLIDREESLHVEHQNVLLRALGQEPEVEVDVAEVPVQPGDYLILCSDGLTRMVPEPDLAEAIARFRHPQRICDRLIEAANAKGGPDNITVVVVEVAKPWWKRLWS